MIIFLIHSFSVILIFMTLFFLLALWLKDNSVVDIAWGIGIVAVSWFGLFTGSSIYWRQILITLLATAWGLRLGIYILVRKRGEGEDFRYRALRQKWEKQVVLKSFFYIFMFQGILQFVMIQPIILVHRSTVSSFGIFDMIGIFLFLVGLIFESVSDWQKYRFKKNPENRGKLMITGLWRFSRHPNYFGEVTLWWGIYLLALPVPGGWIAIFSPLLVTLLLLFISGIPLLEKRYEKNEDFLVYKRSTSVLVPWFPKTNSN